MPIAVCVIAMIHSVWIWVNCKTPCVWLKSVKFKVCATAFAQKRKHTSHTITFSQCTESSISIEVIYSVLQYIHFAQCTQLMRTQTCQIVEFHSLLFCYFMLRVCLSAHGARCKWAQMGGRFQQCIIKYLVHFLADFTPFFIGFCWAFQTGEREGVRGSNQQICDESKSKHLEIYFNLVSETIRSDRFVGFGLSFVYF